MDADNKNKGKTPMKPFLLGIVVLLLSIHANSYTVTFPKGATPEQTEKITKALDEAHTKRLSPEFKAEVLRFKMPDGQNKFHQTILTNEEVYIKLMSGKWDHQIAFYSSCYSSARAYVKGTPTVNLNWCYIKNDPISRISNTLFHEQTHLFGFSHDYKPTKLRPHSVPYASGKIIENLVVGLSVESTPTQSPSSPPEIITPPVTSPSYVPWYKRLWKWITK